MFKWTECIRHVVWGQTKAMCSVQNLQPIKSFMWNCNLVSDSSVGEEKRAYSFPFTQGVAGFIVEKEKSQVMKSGYSFMPLFLSHFHFVLLNYSFRHIKWEKWSFVGWGADINELLSSRCESQIFRWHHCVSRNFISSAFSAFFPHSSLLKKAKIMWKTVPNNVSILVHKVYF